MLPLGPPDIKFSVETQKSPFGDIGNLTKLTHDPLPPYHRVEVQCKNSWKYSKSILSTILPNVRKINSTRMLLLTVGISKMPFFTFHPLKMNSTILAKLFSQKMITSVNINSKFNQGYNFYHNISNLYFQVITF